MSQPNRYTLKLIVTGDAIVGKTSLIKRFTGKDFSSTYMATIGTEIIKRSYKFHDKVIDLHIWDLGGQPMYRKMTKKFFDGADLVIIMFDVTRPETFDNVKGWYESIFNILGESKYRKKIQCMMIGNKVDLVEKRIVTPEEGLKLANDLKTLYIETSVKENKNINQAFVNLIAEYTKMQSFQK